MRIVKAAYYALRFAVLERDDYTCRYCGRSAPSVPLEVDHVIAVADGGTDDPSNLVTCCWSCNRGKEGLRKRRSAGVIKYPCASCGLAADTVHFAWVLGDDGQFNMELACPSHNPGGYWIKMRDLEEHPQRWLDHLAHRRGNMAGQLRELIGA